MSSDDTIITDRNFTKNHRTSEEITFTPYFRKSANSVRMPALYTKRDALKKSHVGTNDSAPADDNANRMGNKHPRPNLRVEFDVGACNGKAQSGKKPRQIDPTSQKKPMAHPIKQDSLKASLKDDALPEDPPLGKHLSAQDIGLSEA